VRDRDCILLGSISALNVSAAFFAALHRPKGKTIVTFACDLGERSTSKLYNKDYLTQRGLETEPESLENMISRYKQSADRIVKVVR